MTKWYYQCPHDIDYYDSIKKIIVCFYRNWQQYWIDLYDSQILYVYFQSISLYTYFHTRLFQWLISLVKCCYIAFCLVLHHFTQLLQFLPFFFFRIEIFLLHNVTMIYWVNITRGNSFGFQTILLYNFLWIFVFSVSNSTLIITSDTRRVF